MYEYQPHPVFRVMHADLFENPKLAVYKDGALHVGRRSFPASEWNGKVIQMPRSEVLLILLNALFQQGQSPLAYRLLDYFFSMPKLFHRLLDLEQGKSPGFVKLLANEFADATADALTEPYEQPLVLSPNGVRRKFEEVITKLEQDYGTPPLPKFQPVSTIESVQDVVPKPPKPTASGVRCEATAPTAPPLPVEEQEEQEEVEASPDGPLLNWTYPTGFFPKKMGSKDYRRRFTTATVFFSNEEHRSGLLKKVESILVPHLPKHFVEDQMSIDNLCEIFARAPESVQISQTWIGAVAWISHLVMRRLDAFLPGGLIKINVPADEIESFFGNFVIHASWTTPPIPVQRTTDNGPDLAGAVAGVGSRIGKT